MGERIEFGKGERVYGRLTEDWCWRFLFEACVKASWSKDPSTQCGAVVVDPVTKDILGSGYNGFPPGVGDTVERLTDREQKYPLVLHAEDNALWRARKWDLVGMAIFMWPGPPCTPCTAKIIRAGLGAVFAPEPSEDMASRWQASFDTAAELLDEAGVRQIRFPRDELVDRLTAQVAALPGA